MRDLDVGIGIVHLDVLGARLRRARRRMLWLMCIGLLGASVWQLWTPLAQRLWGIGMLTVTAPAQVALFLNGAPMTAGTQQLIAGSYDVTARQAGWYPYATAATVTREHTTTLTIPPLRPRPVVHPVPLPASGMEWTAIGSAGDGSWVLTASEVAAADTAVADSPRGTPPPTRRTITRVRANAMQMRPSNSDTGALQDEIVRGGTRWWASSTAAQRGFQTWGLLTIHTPTATQTLTPTAPVRGLWWSPGGAALLVAAMPRAAGTALTIWRPGQTELDSPVVIIPGDVLSIHWHPAGTAAVVISRHGTSPQDATLLTAIGTDQPQAQGLPAGPNDGAGLPLLAWSSDAVYWVAQGEPSATLLRIPLDGTLPTTLGSLRARTVALHVVADQIWVLTHDTNGLALRAWPDGSALLVIDDVPATEHATGAWAGRTLLLMEDLRHVWTLTFAPAALPSPWCSSACSALD